MAKRRFLLRTAPATLFLLVLAPLLSGCAEQNPQTVLIAKGPVAQGILDLHKLIGVMSAIVFFGVFGLLLFVTLRYRQRRAGGAPPPQIHGNTRLEVMWTLVPVLIVVIMGVPTVQLIASSANPPKDKGDPLQVTVIGHQWWFEFQYPTLGITTANELHIPVGRPIELTLESKDVIHSFWVPALGGKTDAIPNRQNKMWFLADEPGVYKGQCMEFCGTSHALMRHRAIAQPAAEFDAWVKSQQPPATAPTGGDAQRGMTLMQRSGCYGCHTINGIPGAQGQLGPNLTHLASRGIIAGGVIELSDADRAQKLAEWIKDPPAFKPDSVMPKPGAPPTTVPLRTSLPALSDDDINAIVAFLVTLK